MKSSCETSIFQWTSKYVCFEVVLNRQIQRSYIYIYKKKGLLWLNANIEKHDFSLFAIPILIGFNLEV